MALLFPRFVGHVVRTAARRANLIRPRAGFETAVHLARELKGTGEIASGGGLGILKRIQKAREAGGAFRGANLPMGLRSKAPRITTTIYKQRRAANIRRPIETRLAAEGRARLRRAVGRTLAFGGIAGAGYAYGQRRKQRA